MGILTALHHVTHYSYDRPVRLGPQTIRLRPAPHTRAHVQSYSLKVLPEEHFINWQQDPFGNYLARLVFPEPTREFRVEVDLVSEIKVFNPFDFFVDDYAESFPFSYPAELKEELVPYLEIKERDAELLEILAKVTRKELPIVDFLVSVNSLIYNTLDYTIRMEPGVQSCATTLQKNSGSCRDMAWLLVQMLRHMGLAARFVSGYLIQLKQDEKSLDGPSGTEEDFTDLHAWAEVYLPGAGWIGLDATSGLFTGEGHIPLCATPNPSSAAPISGALDFAESTLKHEMTITRIKEDRRVTRPYSDMEWEEIDALGALVDKDIKKRDIRLTMGGEPTFVSLDDRTSAQWHTEALGEEKEALGLDLLKRLAGSFGTGGLLHTSQGKWYPGEILPRWAYHCTWRKDGLPLWQNTDLLADPAQDCQHTTETARDFMAELALNLGIPARFVLPAREDTPFYLWKEHRQPLEEEMLEADVYEQTERARLQRLMNADLNAPVGYVLPLHHSPKRKTWISNPWAFRSEHLILIPGDSPVGLRLPLGALPAFHDPNEFVPERDPFEQKGKLPTAKQFASLAKKRALKTPDAATSFDADPIGLVRTALSAEVRGGTLHLFLPPLSLIEDFLDLVSSIEMVAAKTKTKVIIEGYAPPHDQRLSSFSVTPDPGVIEVNVHPAADWQELKNIVSTVYTQAKQARLVTDKFLIDGRRVGTGGGNHVIVGAAKPADSPFLRRPDLLRSMVAFWQNHPSLSYLFAGQYIGPTSQAPRIDEARHDSLYELDIAFNQIPKPKENTPFWLTDRLFRNLLVDLTGNTHRAEFCIDKLYAPDGRRLGLVELRAFEMSPHYQMNLVQALLIRAAISHFWERPYKGKLVHWGTRLHDDFMLPYYVAEDMKDVIATLDEAGYGFRASWFDPFMDFRFPIYGQADIGPVNLELRNALEPWPVMGEEAVGGSVSRAVDSSVERLQVKASGMVEGRHIVTCNGHMVPLKATQEKGVYVAGVRYKAWAPSSALHPTIPVHTPLVFDVIDTAYERSLGGCTYHVAHPGGRNYEEIPINENEAEGRRLSRFQNSGHTPGKVRLPEQVSNPYFPGTLDLRWVHGRG